MWYLVYGVISKLLEEMYSGFQPLIEKTLLKAELENESSS